MIVFAFPVAVINSSKFPTNPRVGHGKTKCWQPSPCGFWLLLLLDLRPERWSMDRVVRTCPRSITNPVRSYVTWKSVSSIPLPFCVPLVTLFGKGIATERSRTQKKRPTLWFSKFVESIFHIGRECRWEGLKLCCRSRLLSWRVIRLRPVLGFQFQRRQWVLALSHSTCNWMSLCFLQLGGMKFITWFLSVGVFA